MDLKAWLNGWTRDVELKVLYRLSISFFDSRIFFE